MGEYNFTFDPNGEFDPLDIGETDTVELTYTISDGFYESTASIYVVVNGLENGLVLNGSDGIDGLYGSSLDDTLIGHGANDILKGYAGQDYMEDGAGNDRFYVDDIYDDVVEAADGGVSSYFPFSELRVARSC